MADATLDEELAEGLKQARKKPRNFAIIAKGSLPLKLMVQKKRFRDGELLKAKSEAKGNAIITGVLVANGPDYAFQVVGEEPTLKPLKLKELIAEQADMTVKPRFEIVTELPEVSEADDESGPDESARGQQADSREESQADQPAISRGQDQPSTATTSTVAYAKLLLAFEGARKKLHADLQKLEQAILSEFAGDPELAEVQQSVRKLDEIVAAFDDRLKDLFDDAVNLPAAERGKVHREAIAVVDGYLAYLSGDPFVRDVADNPFGVPVSVKLMNDTLSLIAKNLA